jgi:hypothetical protein
VPKVPCLPVPILGRLKSPRPALGCLTRYARPDDASERVALLEPVAALPDRARGWQSTALERLACEALADVRSVGRKDRGRE